MKTIKFKKILAYDPTIGGKYSRYEGYCRITSGMEDPGIIPGQDLIKTKEYKKTICSTLRRAGESIEGEYETSLLVNEVVFSLETLVSREEFEKEGSNVVRKKFIEAFCEDCLTEKRHEVKRRMDLFLQKMNKKSVGLYLVVSHSFFMKILEAYIHEKDLFDNPIKLADYLNPIIKTYNFGEGFEFKL